MSTSFSRRGLLQLGLSAAAATGVLSIAAGYDLLVVPPRPVPGGRILSAAERTLIERFARLYFPPGNAIGVAADGPRIAGQLDGWLAQTPPVDPHVVRVALHAVDAAPLPTHGARFLELDDAAQAAFLDDLASSSSPALNGLEQLPRMLVSLFYFEDDAVIAALGAKAGCAL